MREGKTTLLTRADEVGAGPFDSIAWAFEVHVKAPDSGAYNCALMYGWNEDSPTRIEFWTDPMPAYDVGPDFVWEPAD